MEIFKQKELKKPNLFQKLIGKNPSENAIIEINNLLSSSEFEIEKITFDQIISIANKYKINFKNKFIEYRREIFNTYLKHCLIDSNLDDSELKSLKHLKDILLLDDVETQELINQETKKIYNQNLKSLLADGKLDSFEKQKLINLRKGLMISEDVARKLYERNANEVLQNFIEGAISDERLSPDEEIEINEIANNLGIDLKPNEMSQELLDRYKLYWQIENGTLPEIKSPINIQKSEKLHFKTYVKWLEQKRVTKRINYAGPSARIKIMKGVYYRVGSIKAQSITEDVWQTIDSGNLYLTNKRIIFMGSKGNKTIAINNILDFTPFKNGIDIQKDSGKCPFLEFENNIDLFSMILVRLQNEN